VEDGHATSTRSQESEPTSFRWYHSPPGRELYSATSHWRISRCIGYEEGKLQEKEKRLSAGQPRIALREGPERSKKAVKGKKRPLGGSGLLADRENVPSDNLGRRSVESGGKEEPQRSK